MPQQPRLLFGRSASMLLLREQCARLAPTSYPLLILGERGTGKTVLARYLHELSGRSGELVKESAAALPDSLVHGLMGGHARGSFTGAVGDRMGLIEAAHRGTLFLDELGLASPVLQGYLLQLLDDGAAKRLGELRTRPVDVRIIAATNADLRGMAERGTFRPDLVDRFGFFTLYLPSLAERREEIIPLAEMFLLGAAAEMGRADPPILTPDVKDWLVAAPWHGNIRELRELCVYLVAMVDPGDLIEFPDLPPAFTSALQGLYQKKKKRRRRGEVPPMDRLSWALHEAAGNKAEAARLLGLSRRQFYRLLDLPEPDWPARPA